MKSTIAISRHWISSAALSLFVISSLGCQSVANVASDTGDVILASFETYLTDDPRRDASYGDSGSRPATPSSQMLPSSRRRRPSAPLDDRQPVRSAAVRQHATSPQAAHRYQQEPVANPQPVRFSLSDAPSQRAERPPAVNPFERKSPTYSSRQPLGSRDVHRQSIRSQPVTAQIGDSGNGRPGSQPATRRGADRLAVPKTFIAERDRSRSGGQSGANQPAAVPNRGTPPRLIPQSSVTQRISKQNKLEPRAENRRTGEAENQVNQRSVAVGTSRIDSSVRNQAVKRGVLIRDQARNGAARVAGQREPAGQPARKSFASGSPANSHPAKSNPAKLSAAGKSPVNDPVADDVATINVASNMAVTNKAVTNKAMTNKTVTNKTVTKKAETSDNSSPSRPATASSNRIRGFVSDQSNRPREIAAEPRRRTPANSQRLARQPKNDLNSKQSPGNSAGKPQIAQRDRTRNTRTSLFGNSRTGDPRPTPLFDRLFSSRLLKRPASSPMPVPRRSRAGRPNVAVRRPAPTTKDGTASRIATTVTAPDKALPKSTQVAKTADSEKSADGAASSSDGVARPRPFKTNTIVKAIQSAKIAESDTSSQADNTAIPAKPIVAKSAEGPAGAPASKEKPTDSPQLASKANRGAQKPTSEETTGPADTSKVAADKKSPAAVGAEKSVVRQSPVQTDRKRSSVAGTSKQPRSTPRQPASLWHSISGTIPFLQRPPATNNTRRPAGSPSRMVVNRRVPGATSTTPDRQRSRLVSGQKPAAASVQLKSGSSRVPSAKQHIVQNQPAKQANGFRVSLSDDSTASLTHAHVTSIEARAKSLALQSQSLVPLRTPPRETSSTAGPAAKQAQVTRSRNTDVDAVSSRFKSQVATSGNPARQVAQPANSVHNGFRAGLSDGGYSAASSAKILPVEKRKAALALKMQSAASVATVAAPALADHRSKDPAAQRPPGTESQRASGTVTQRASGTVTQRASGTVTQRAPNTEMPLALNGPEVPNELTRARQQLINRSRYRAASKLGRNPVSRSSLDQPASGQSYGDRNASSGHTLFQASSPFHASQASSEQEITSTFGFRAGLSDDTVVDPSLARIPSFEQRKATMLAALQETDPQNSILSSGSSAGPDGGPRGTGPGGSGDQTLGETQRQIVEEAGQANLQFLREQTILLDPGEYQIDVDFQYLTDESSFAFANVTQNGVLIGEATRRQRLLMLPIEVRLGITPVLQGFVNVPFGWSNNEFSFQGEDEFTNVGGLGDISAGLTRMWVEESECFPTVLTTFAFSAPTGNSDFATSLSTPGSGLGQGFWSLTGDVSFINTYDPVVLFYGFGYRHRFNREFFGGFDVDPGALAFYRFGLGFAVNPRITLSATFFGSYIAETKVNGRRVAGDIREPRQLRFAATIARDPKYKDCRGVKLIEPFVNFGLNEAAIDTVIGLGLTW